ncbi:hypothetical protein LTR84_011391 [Exophiala bonariae]|uniref:Uncharacterized protein n=1 Tax=Exophiala bonariae TaxID=1690606 RepID=A0AAV9MS64_9EURO|nr:hypothetical protein LTR84_011391 [Exophiala bonariae]
MSSRNNQRRTSEDSNMPVYHKLPEAIDYDYPDANPYPRRGRSAAPDFDRDRREAQVRYDFHQNPVYRPGNDNFDPLPHEHAGRPRYVQDPNEPIRGCSRGRGQRVPRQKADYQKYRGEGRSLSRVDQAQDYSREPRFVPDLDESPRARQHYREDTRPPQHPRGEVLHGRALSHQLHQDDGSRERDEKWGRFRNREGPHYIKGQHPEGTRGREDIWPLENDRKGVHRGRASSQQPRHGVDSRERDPYSQGVTDYDDQDPSFHGDKHLEKSSHEFPRVEEAWLPRSQSHCGSRQPILRNVEHEAQLEQDQDGFLGVPEIRPRRERSLSEQREAPEFGDLRSLRRARSLSGTRHPVAGRGHALDDIGRCYPNRQELITFEINNRCQDHQVYVLEALPPSSYDSAWLGSAKRHRKSQAQLVWHPKTARFTRKRETQRDMINKALRAILS